MLCVCALLHCQQICAERKFRKIERTYLHSLYSCTTSNVTMCFNFLEWHAREVCLLQNNFSELWLINSLNEWTIHHCAKKKWQKLPSLQYDNMHQFSGATQTNRASVLWLVRYSAVWKQPHWPKDQTAANQTAALECCRSTVHLMILVFFYIYTKIDLNLFTYCFFKAYILLMDQRFLRS